MKNCELCKAPARIYCEADQANLCWDCDTKVHGANFLVARHSRNLLCQACQSLTLWKASGPKLGLTATVCEGCAFGEKTRVNEGEESEGRNYSEIDVGCDDDVGDRADDDHDDVEEEEEEEEEYELESDGENGDNQVVPWSSPPLPPSASSSSSQESVFRFDDSISEGDGPESATLFSLKRKREDASDLPSQDDPYRSSRYSSASTAQADAFADDGEHTSVESFRPLKDLRTEADWPVQLSISMPVVSSLRLSHRKDMSKTSESSDGTDIKSSESLSRGSYEKTKFV